MPTLAGPAVDPTMRTPAVVEVEAFALDAPEPPIPAPVWDPTAEGLRVQVLLGRAITREVIGCLESAQVDGWSHDVELLVGTSASVTASTWDPLWAAAGDLVGVSADGRLVYEWDPKGYIVWVCLDGAPVWTGIFRSPVDIGGGRVSLNPVGPQAMFAERSLGRPEQEDHYGDRGSFEDYGSIAEMEADGWVFGAGISASLIAGGVRGAKCLRVIGSGWVSAPKITLEGAEGYGRTVEAACFARFHDSIEPGTEVIRTRARRISNNAEDYGYRDQRAGARPDDSSGFTQSPITSGARMQPYAVAHQCWAEFRSYTGVNTDYDLVTLRQGVTTGFPPGAEKDWSQYVERIHRDLIAQSLGGSPTGLKTRLTLTGNSPTEAMRWNHNQRTPVRDVLSMVIDVDGGPECRITPGWNLEILPRLGEDRGDVAITQLDIVSPEWTVDPGAQIEDYTADTGRGSGTSAVSSTVQQTFFPDRFRVQAFVTAPVGRSLNEVDAWTERNAEVAARLQITARLLVRWAVGVSLRAGDTVWVSIHDGLLAVDRRMRVVNVRPRPSLMVVEVQLGEHGG